MGEPSPNHLGDLPPCIWANHRLVFVHMQKKNETDNKTKKQVSLIKISIRMVLGCQTTSHHYARIVSFKK